MGSQGYHLYSLIKHVCSPIRNDFVEMLLHHVLTITLYTESYMCYQTQFGSVIMFMHDWADLPTMMVRIFVETSHTNIASFFAVLMALTWGYSRLVIFPQIIY